MSESVEGARDVGRCPSCGARVVPDQDWCSLCLQPLRVEVGPAEAAPGGAAAADPASGRPGPAEPAEHDPTDPYASGACGPPPPADDLPPLAAEAMLAELAATSAADRPFARGPLAGTSRGVRAALGCGAAVVLIGILTLVLTLVGMLL